MVAAANAQGPVKLRVAFPTAAAYEDIPALLSAERLRTQGIELQPIFTARAAVALDAVIRGDADVGKGTPQALIAIQRGAPLRFFVTQGRNPWTLYGKKEISRCEDLTGRRLALHDYVTISTALVRAWLKEKCPSANPSLLVISGSSNRATALIAGQIDLTPLELQDVIQLDHLRPGQFHTLVNFGKEAPWLAGPMLFATTKTLAGKHDAVTTFVRELIKLHRLIAADPGIVATVAPKYVKFQDPSLLAEVSRQYVEIGFWPVDGGFTQDTVRRTIRFYVDAGSMDAGLTADQAGDYTIVRDALKALK